MTKATSYQDGVKVGEGGFADVFECRSDTGELFAKKRFAARTTSEAINEQALKRFIREVELLKALRHPNIIRVLATRVGRGEPYWFVMPLCACSLEDNLDEIRANEESRAKVLAQVFDAVEYAHSQGVLHRDIKPSNLLFLEGDHVVVSDFGLGRQTTLSETRATLTGMRLGTQFYSAPEAIAGDAKRADHRADIYSLGILMYELYTSGRAVGRLELDELPSGIRYIVDKATRRDPDRRYSSVAQMRSDFEVYLADREERAASEQMEGALGRFLKHGELQAADEEFILDRLAQCIGDPAAAYEAIVDMPAGMVKALARLGDTRAQGSLRAFATHCGDTGWPFSHCDKLCDQLESAFEATDASELKGWILVQLIRLGIDHNRFYVLGRATSLVEANDDPDVAFAIRDALDELEDHAASRIRTFLEKRNAPTCISTIRCE